MFAINKKKSKNPKTSYIKKKTLDRSTVYKMVINVKII